MMLDGSTQSVCSLPTLVLQFQRQARAASASASLAAAAVTASLQPAERALQHAMHLLATATPSSCPAALQQACSARAVYRSAAAKAVAPQAAIARRHWLHNNERACPTLTALTRPPHSSTSTPHYFGGVLQLVRTKWSGPSIVILGFRYTQNSS